MEMKPISTLRKSLKSVDINTKKEKSAHKERSDVCAVPSASIIAEHMMSFAIADTLLDKFDIATGAFDVVRHNDNAGEFIKLKDDLILNNDDYVQVVWSDKLLEFDWNTTYPGHLQVKIV